MQRTSQRELTRVAISGPLGIGISRLLDELETRIARASDLAKVSIVRARSLEPEAGIAYAGLRAALGRDFDRAVAAKHELQAPEQRGARVRESLLRLLESKAGSGQVCLIVEDLEHSDPGTRELISMLLRLRRKVALTLIVTYHGDEIGRAHGAAALRAEIEASDDVERIALEPLSVDELLALVEALDGERPTLSFMAAVRVGSRGNPLVAAQPAPGWHPPVRPARRDNPRPTLHAGPADSARVAPVGGGAHADDDRFTGQGPTQRWAPVTRGNRRPGG
jgi:predicted ATPase